MSTKKKAPPEDEYGVLMHTALRKCCDSTMTSIAWNIIQLLGPTWVSFAAACSLTEATTGAELASTFSQWNDKTPLRFPEGAAPESFYAAQVFRIALEEFDEYDWQGMAAYLGES